MKTLRKPVVVLLLALAVVVTSVNSLLAEEETLKLQGTISGCSGKHTVRISVFDHRIFEDGKPLKQVDVKPSEVKSGSVAFSFNMPPGTYTISAYEDENGNGKIDMGAFGPKEPSGFYKKFTAWRAPKFEDVKFELKSNMDGANIKLK